MKPIIGLFFLYLFFVEAAIAQRSCGYAPRLSVLTEHNPEAYQTIQERRQYIAQNGYQNDLSKLRTQLRTTSTPGTIPVVFHLVIDSAVFYALNGISGIESRLKSQLEVINNDFNGANTDKVKVPSVWTALFANVGIKFGLASIDPNGNPSPGYTLKIVPNGTSFTVGDGAKALKFSASGGTDCWDNTKYLNVWIGNLKFTGSDILGVTVPPSEPGYTKPEYGIALNQYAFGVRDSPGMVFIRNIDRGRTLTHELGHFFKLWHTWGDDLGLCPGAGGMDDGIADTPPQGDATYGDPNFPLFDVCTPASNGIMFMNFLDYTNDSSMYMFTQGQASVMRAEVLPGGDSYSLTLNEYLSDTQVKPPVGVLLYPNPSKGIVFIKYDFTRTPLKSIVVYNLLGQKIIEFTNQNINAIDLSSYGRGLYFVHCFFDQEVIKEKITID